MRAIALSALALACAGGGLQPANPLADPRVAYTIRRADSTTLSISLTATGLPVAAPLIARLENWGEWTSAPFAYLHGLLVDGRPAALDSTGATRVPGDLLADGRLEVRYDLTVPRLGSVQHEARRLLPYRTDRHLFGFVSNTLMGFLVDTVPLPASATIRIVAQPGDDVFTGWGGFAAGTSPLPVPGVPFDNAVFAIGRPTGRTTADSGVQVAQFRDGPDSTAIVASAARSLIAAYSAALGRGPRQTMRILVEGQEGGGTYTDHGMVVNGLSVELLAHELFHDWLGGRLTGDESLVWFSEGFTDYFSLWHAAALGLVPRDRFGQRMLEVEARARAGSLGRIAFADSGVRWRDGNGPNETMAYRGGSLLAFAVDAELRRRGTGTAHALIRRLLEIAPRPYRLADIRDAFASLGLSALYRQSVAGRQMPPVLPVLVELGFDQTEEQAALTYLGIEARLDRTDSMDVVPAVVTALDSAGPAAKAGLRVGDRITGYGDRRGNPPQRGPGAPERYLWALNVIPSGARSGTLEVERDGTVRKIDVAPVLTRGGRRVQVRWRAGTFFEPETTRTN